MFDEGTQTTAAYPSDLNIAKAAQPSPLAQLIDTQEKTKHLLQVLGEKLAPVSNPHPVEARDRLNGGYHPWKSKVYIHTALSQQHEINDAITYLLDTVVV